MRVLLLGRYARRGASTRLRFLQYLPYLRHAGIEVSEAPLLNDAYLSALYGSGRRPTGQVMLAYVRRVHELWRGRHHDLLWIEKELFPRWPAIIERLIERCGGRYVVDYDDAVFHDYDRHRHPLFRRMLAHKIDAVMRHAKLVVAGNEYLAARARSAGAGRIEVLPTVIDLDRYPAAVHAARDRYTIGWVGTPMTVRYLAEISEVLSQMAAEGQARISVVGARLQLTRGATVESRSWSEEREVADIQDFDVGIMPLADGPWERGKCGYKLVQYMACGKPVVASPVGVNTEIVKHGVNGFLANTPAEWLEALQLLRRDPQLRQRMGVAGRRLVEERYCLSVTAPQLLGLLSEAAEVRQSVLTPDTVQAGRRYE